MGRVALGIVAVAVSIAMLAVVRALSVAAPAMPALTEPLMAVDARSVAEHLGAAVRFRTVSYSGRAHETEKNAELDALRAWMSATYPNFHKAAKREVVGRSLLFTWKGRDPVLKPILLMAHMDVAPVVPGTEASWSHTPFSGDVAGGYVWGRGSIDDKASLVTLLEAAERLAKSGFAPERTIMFAFGDDEEAGGASGNGIIAKMLTSRGVHFDFVLDEGSAIADEPFPGIEHAAAFVGVAEKGYASVEIVAHGEGGHSSRPTRDMTIVRLADTILKIVNHPFASGLDETEREKLVVLAPYASFPERLLLANLWLTAPIVEHLMAMTPEGAARLHTTIAPTLISGGIKDDVLPPEAQATINFRLHPRDNIASVVEHLRNVLDDPKVDIIVLNETKEEASKAADIRGVPYRHLAQQISESFGVPVAPDLATGATDSRYYLPISDAVFRFEPFRLDGDDLGRVHGTNERLALRNLAPAVAFYMRLIENAK